MTLKMARKILGKEAESLSDEKLEKIIDSATLLKDLFFDNYTKGEQKA